MLTALPRHDTSLPHPGPAPPCHAPGPCRPLPQPSALQESSEQWRALFKQLVHSGEHRKKALECTVATVQKMFTAVFFSACHEWRYDGPAARGKPGKEPPRIERAVDDLLRHFHVIVLLFFVFHSQELDLLFPNKMPNEPFTPN